MKPAPSRAMIRQSPRVRNYFQEFQMINYQNQQLIRLAESITRSSFMHPSCPAIIAQTEQQLRKNLSIFVDSIREFFIDMDHRLRALAQAFQQDAIRNENEVVSNRAQKMNQREPFARQQHSNQNIVLKINQMTDPYQVFSEKITALETSLKKTQENEAKLLEIVQKLSKKSQQFGLAHDEVQMYPRPELRQDFAREPSKHVFMNQNSHQSSFRLFSLHRDSKNVKKEANLMGNNKSISFSPFPCPSHEQFRSQQIQGKSETRTVYDSSIDHSHRANFLMKTLIS